MLIIPFDRKIDWKNPPVVTILLIVINFIAYFGWQSGDDRNMEEAMTYYRESGLATMEQVAYKKYLEGHAKALPEIYQPAKDIVAEGKKDTSMQTWSEWSLSDYEFATVVRSGQLLPTEAENYREWREKRSVFEQMLSRVVFWKYGLKTDEFHPLKLVAHMFLHANFMHLFGNMFFLMAVGFLVERTFGSKAYLLCYLIVGLGGAAFDFIFTPDRVVPGIGASGAVSGLMGMYAVLFWTRRIRFFYFFFVIFGFATLPAIILLPLWIGDQLFLFLTDSESHINYLAHLGGLSFGGTIALLIRSYLPSYSLESFEQEDEDEDFELQLEQAIDLCDALEYRKAHPILRRLHAQRPNDARIWHYLYPCGRLQPDSDTYHKIAHKILGQQQFDRDTNEWILEIFRDYLQRAKPGPRFDMGLSMRLASRFIETGKLQEAERLVIHLLKRPGIKAAAVELASDLGHKMLQTGDFERGRKLLAYVEKTKQ